MELRVKTLVYNAKRQLEELDLGPAPWGKLPEDGASFEFISGDRIYPNCYVEYEPKPPQTTGFRLLGYAVILLVSCGTSFLLAVVLGWLNP